MPSDLTIPSKLDLLISAGELTSVTISYLLQAEEAKKGGNMPAAEAAYAGAIDAGRKHLDVVLRHNEHYVPPMPVEPVAHTLVNALFMRADILDALGRGPEAEANRREASVVSERHLGGEGVAEAERSRAASLTAQGRFPEALVALATARDFYRGHGNALQTARVALDMADILQWVGDFERALAEVDSAAAMVAPRLSGKKPTRQGMGTEIVRAAADIMAGKSDGKTAGDYFQLYRISVEVDYYRGLVSRATGRFDEAEKFFGIVLPEYAALGVGPAIEYQQAAILSGRGKHREALDAVRRLEPLFRSGGLLRPKLGALLKLEADALLNLQAAEEALEKVREGIADLARYGDKDLLWRLQWLEGRILQAMGADPDALGAYGRAVETVLHLRRAPLGYRLDSTFLKDKLPLFEAAMDLAARRSDPESCCRFIESIKSRTLTAVLGLPGGGDGSGTASETRSRLFDEITRRADALEYRAYREGDSAQLRDERDRLLAERASLLEQITYSDPRWRTLTAPLPFEYREAKRLLLERRQAAISLYYRPGRVVAVLIAGGREAVGERTIPEKITRKLEMYARNLTSPDPQRPLYDISASVGVEADSLVPEDLLAAALEAEGLVIVPHGILHLVPWAGLAFRGKRLFEHCPVGVLPNLGCMIRLGRDPSPAPGVALFGSPKYRGLDELPPLPEAGREIAEIATLYSRAGRLIGAVRKGPEATERAYRELATRADAADGILHVACHGAVVPHEPMNSGLLFEDGKLDVAEIARMPVRYGEVVLSACSTGWRPVKVQGIELSGDDILGLPGAYLEAGASSVLVSIPPAADKAASRFMVLYHGFRVTGTAPMRALQQTQKAMAKAREHAPAEWIGFTLYGCR